VPAALLGPESGLDAIDPRPETLEIVLETMVSLGQPLQVSHDEALLLREVEQRGLDHREPGVRLVQLHVRLIDLAVGPADFVSDLSQDLYGFGVHRRPPEYTPGFIGRTRPSLQVPASSASMAEIVSATHPSWTVARTAPSSPSDTRGQYPARTPRWYRRHVMVTVRPVEHEDVPAVIEHVARVLAEFGLEFGVGSETDDAVRALPASYFGRGGAFWIACAPSSDGGDALVGTCGVFPVGPGVYELRKMYLDPRTRGHGVGTRLLEVAIAWVRAQGGVRMVLDTTEAMTSAIAFYERHGFVRDDAQIRGARCSRGYARPL
jgi:GNAT superfamily N-acetyltransferase